MVFTTRKKIAAAVILLVLVGIFLPPQINGARFGKRLAAELSSALGREVKIGAVNFRLLPRPGFDLYDFEVLDDPAFSAEPLLMCGEVTADLRLTSLWQGRLEIANLKLNSASDRMPPSLNLVYANGHWNIESLLVRAEQVPTAPTAKRSAEQRPRFPYIAADAGRINFKVGPEKKPYAFTNADFSFWLAAENLWHLRLEGRPVRTDMNLTDTGIIRVEGDLKRASDLRQTPVKLQVAWQQAQLGQVSRLALGHDKGWRGGLQVNAELTGTLNDMHMTAQTDLQDLRRYDISRGGAMLISARCQAGYDQSSIDFHCSIPFGNGGMKLSGQITPGMRPEYDLALVVSRVPISALASFALRAKSTLPDDLTATGEVDAAFAFHAHEHTPRDWHGTGMTTSFVLTSSAATKPVPVGPIHFHMGAPEINEEPALGRKKTPASAAPAARNTAVVTIEPFSLQLVNGTLVQAQGILGPADYHFEVRGAAPLERCLDLGRLTGFPARVGASGTATMDLKIDGPWANFAPPRLTGGIRLQNLAATIPGIKNRLLMTEAHAQISDSSLELTQIAAQFDHSPVGFTGSIQRPLNCPADAPCPLQFNLHSDKLNLADLTSLLGLNQSSWNLPFLSSSDKLPGFRANGTLHLDSLNLGGIPMEKFTASVEAGDRTLLLDRIDARIAGGTLNGRWNIDWSGQAPRYSGSGAVAGAAIEKLDLPSAHAALLSEWVTGKTSLKYDVLFSGKTHTEMLASASGRTQFQVVNGTSKSLNVETGKILKFQNLQGAFEFDHGNLKLLPGKIRTATRIYDFDGTVTLNNQQARLNLSSGAAQWKVTGPLDKPAIAARPASTQAVSAHR